ncbi:xanthine dehydrogenase family protein molybdopterin-binding subunit [Guyparkeria hydrothermalis]|uniref:xanthine dehydrogenase family protein molybdopterin-binding subunit n=1 Tax=Guyparkeria hydrothermalis TaxID=923 RepID=UPI002021A9E4|nr:xanthine dehydrogenase family protein molybdopterin-binding subunit [Guyparkeria hydrothermalis]MCL7745145.1 xanthine dehydrogenase family protein molybdopterin-binding subunit [Guyparkeria hydrothermalis]
MTTRRQFLKVSAAVGGGLLIGFRLGAPESARAATAGGTPDDGADVLEPNAWIEMHPDGRNIVTVSGSEMGQGAMTVIPMMIAEELDLPWADFDTRFAPADPVYANPVLGSQVTGGSATVRGFYNQLREVGASARELLVQAAANRWGVPMDQLRTEPGVVVHTATGRQAEYRDLVADAAGLEPPEEVFTKSPEQFRLIGQPTKRLDSPQKVTGQAGFGIDARPDQLLKASIARCPVFGGTLKSVDASKAKKAANVVGVIEMESGVAVLARDWWSADQARGMLSIEWNEGELADLDDEAIDTQFREGVGAGKPARSEGRGAEALVDGENTIEATYRVPYLAHTTMEPMNATASVHEGGVTVWVPTQAQGSVQKVAAEVAGVDKDKVTVHTTFLGGGFGRRFETDFVREAVELSKQAGRPVQVVWSRPDDIQHDFYRPAAYNELAATLGDDGLPVAWVHRIAGPSIWSRVAPGMVKEGIDPAAVEGAADHPYQIENIAVTYAKVDPGIPVGFWRSVGHSQNAYVVESFLDELAHKAGSDPVEYRRRLLKKDSRERGVLDRVAEMADWGGKVPEGRARGVAVAKSFGSYCAEVAEVSIEDGMPRVHRVWCAIDCGIAVNPAGVERQMHSGITYGLTAALFGKISIKNGRVQQQNFNDYQALRMDQMPAVEVSIVASGHEPGGVGEPGVPPIAPAVANALASLTGKPVRALPIELDGKA